MNLSLAEERFVELLVETGDPNSSAVAAGLQPSIVRDPRIQSAIIDTIRDHGAADAALGRKMLLDLAKDADLDSVRLRAAQTLVERGIGKVPEQVTVDVNIHSISRTELYEEIRLLITDLDLPLTADAGVAQSVEHSPLMHLEASEGEVAGSSPAAGSIFKPALPLKWR